ncbi:MAG: tetratricopeptide repeat protein [Myxococcota bacterium]
MRSRKRREVDEVGLDIFYEKILRLYDENKFTEAIKSVKDAIRHYPYSSEPYIWLGDLLFESSDLLGALESYHKAINLDEKNYIALSAAAKIYFLIGDFEKANSYVDRSLDNNPEEAEALYLKALLLDRDGNFSLADQYLKKANLIEPENYPKPISISRTNFEVLIKLVLQKLPDRVREFMDNITIVVEDVPSASDIEAEMSPLSLSKLSIENEPAGRVFKIVLFRRNIEHFSQDESELKENINICLLNEINKILTVLEGDIPDGREHKG